MSRENIFTDASREDWMTEELEKELRMLAVDGRVSCAQAQNFAEKHNIPLSKMRPFLDVLLAETAGCIVEIAQRTEPKICFSLFHALCRHL